MARTTTPPEERKRDRQMIELLNELRVALPGLQILFAFLLTVPFAGWASSPWRSSARFC